ncbi:MAG: HlyC/CorC family transporter [Candidatus Marinimicrobia bacterium]|nr:HlyC/CorC family transporter [Candidatus Neomarinimicrobiota bacterium]MBT6471907.1 HlyC/CorC family transporter [Candidatus Neomarinimicrobiota bacterium]MBT7270101.1 HlyC/CorC family transporter [Candidatus Neomarinimicrobiota bacterium]
MTSLILYFTFALAVSFLCSLLESALLSISHAHVAVLVKDEKKSAIILEKLKQNISRPLAAILTLNTIANTVGAAGVGAETLVLYGNKWVALSSAILTLCILIFSEIIPKTLGSVYAKSMISFLAYTIEAMMIITIPFVWMSESLSGILKRNGDNGNKVSRDELVAMAELGEDEGSIDEQESDIIENLMKLDDVKAEDVMTPRSVVFALQKDKTVGEVAKKHSPIIFSRIPVFDNSLDDIIGFVHRFHIMNKQAEDQFDVQIKQIMEDVHAVLEKDSISDILNTFVKRREQIFIVADEFGTTTGIITLEDAIETLLGVEIVDEMDSVVDMRKLAAEKLARERAERKSEK